MRPDGGDIKAFETAHLGRVRRRPTKFVWGPDPAGVVRLSPKAKVGCRQSRSTVSWPRPDNTPPG